MRTVRISFLSVITLVLCAAWSADAWWNPFSLGSRISGDWERGNRVFTFQKGIMVIKRSGSVYATYEIMNSNTLRFTRRKNDYNRDFMVIVEFPTSNQMVWYRKLGNKKQKLWTFTRSQ